MKILNLAGRLASKVSQLLRSSVSNLGATLYEVEEALREYEEFTINNATEYKTEGMFVKDIKPGLYFVRNKDGSSFYATKPNTGPMYGALTIDGEYVFMDNVEYVIRINP